ncbi:MAG: hypothetical protein NVS3B28_26070 [Candidatus Velthaea sp.]
MYKNSAESATLEKRPCAIIHDSRSGAEIVHAFGILDAANVDMFESALVGSVRIGRALVVDFRECPAIDDSILVMLARARHALGRHLRLLAAEGTGVHRKLAASGLAPCLQIAHAWNI